MGLEASRKKLPDSFAPPAGISLSRIGKVGLSGGEKWREVAAAQTVTAAGCPFLYRHVKMANVRLRELDIKCKKAWPQSVRDNQKDSLN